MERRPQAADLVSERAGGFLRRVDGCLDDEQLARHGEEFFEREDEVLAVVYESERERDVELPRRARVEVVDGRATVLDVEREHFAHERGLTYEVALRVNADDARRAATLQLDRVEARVAAYVEHAPAREVFGQTGAHLLPGRSMKPRAELVNACFDFLSRHLYVSTNFLVCRGRDKPCPYSFAKHSRFQPTRNRSASGVEPRSSNQQTCCATMSSLSV